MLLYTSSVRNKRQRYTLYRIMQKDEWKYDFNWFVSCQLCHGLAESSTKHPDYIFILSLFDYILELLSVPRIPNYISYVYCTALIQLCQILLSYFSVFGKLHFTRLKMDWPWPVFFMFYLPWFLVSYLILVFLHPHPPSLPQFLLILVLPVLIFYGYSLSHVCNKYFRITSKFLLSNYVPIH